jgi:fluoride exporter
MSKLLLLVGIGGFAGAILRYGASGYIQQRAQNADFSYGTIVVNVLGCFLIGFLSQLVESRGMLSAEARVLLVPGFLGAFTTFSTFSNETLNLFRDGESPWALINIAAHILLGLGAVWLGRALAFVIWR